MTNLGKVIFCFILSIALVLSMASASPVYAYKISTEPELSLSVGEVEYILVRGLPNQGFPEYSSSNPSVAEVTTDQYNSSSFRIEALSEGVSTIKFTLIDYLTGKKATAECVVTVTGAAVPIESITIEPKLFFLKIGTEKQLNVKIMPTGANAADVIVKSYDSKIIDINEKAIVKGLAAGYSEILAATRDGKIKTKSRVFVGDEKEVVGIVLENIWSKTKEFLAGESFQVKIPNATCGVRG